VTFQNLPLLQLPPQLQTNRIRSSPAPRRAGRRGAPRTPVSLPRGLLAVNVATRHTGEARLRLRPSSWTRRSRRHSPDPERSEAGLDQLGVRSSISGNARLSLPVQFRRNAISVFERNPGLVSADLSQPFPGSSHRPGNSSDSPAIPGRRGSALFGPGLRRRLCFSVRSDRLIDLPRRVRRSEPPPVQRSMVEDWLHL